MSQLSEIGTISREKFNKVVDSQCENYQIFVFENNGVEVASVTIIIEPKILHSGLSVMHIEDVVTDKNFRGQGISYKLLTHIIGIAKEKCYKVILNCNSDLVNYYERFGFKQKDVQMRLDILN